MKNKGKIIPNGVVLKTHESATVVLLTEQGFDVELIPKSNIQDIHTPDIILNEVRWEMKAPVGNGNALIKNTIQRALKQSPNIIIDLRRAKRHQAKCLRELEKHFKNNKNIKKLKVITKDGRLLDFYK